MHFILHTHTHPPTPKKWDFLTKRWELRHKLAKVHFSAAFGQCLCSYPNEVVTDETSKPISIDLKLGTASVIGAYKMSKHNYILDQVHEQNHYITSSTFQGHPSMPVRPDCIKSAHFMLSNCKKPNGNSKHTQFNDEHRHSISSKCCRRATKMLQPLLRIQTTIQNSVDSTKLRLKIFSTSLAKVPMFKYNWCSFISTDTWSCNGHSWRRGKVMTAPNTDKRTINSQSGTLFVCLLSLALSATTMSVPSSPVLSSAAAGGLDCSLLVASLDIDCSGARSCSYFATYSGNSFLKLGQFLLLAKRNTKSITMGPKYNSPKKRWKTDGKEETARIQWYTCNLK